MSGRTTKSFTSSSRSFQSATSARLSPRAASPAAISSSPPSCGPRSTAAARPPTDMSPEITSIDPIPAIKTGAISPIAAAMPWVKLIVTVSHPLRRLLRHYQTAKKHGLRLSLEDWIAKDLERMQEAGIIQDNTAASSTGSSSSNKSILMWCKPMGY